MTGFIQFTQSGATKSTLESMRTFVPEQLGTRADVPLLYNAVL